MPRRAPACSVIQRSVLADPANGVDDHRRGAGDGSRDRGDVASDPVGQPVACALDRGAAQYPHAAREPLVRLEPVNRYVVRITEAVAAVLLDLPQGEHLVALLAEQEPAVIPLPAGMIGLAHRSPSLC